MGDLQSDALVAKLRVQRVENLDGGNVDIGDGLGIEQKPARRRRTIGDDFPHAFDEMAGIREQEGRVKTVSDQARNGMRSRRVAEIVEATSWQAHSVRGFISGTLGKKMGLAVKSEKREDGTRVYSVAK